MLRRTVLTGLAVLLMAGMGWATPRQNQEDAKPLAEIWTFNLGSDNLELQVERSRHGISQTETILLAPGEVSQVHRSAGEEVRIQDHPDLLLVTASAGFDPASLGLGRTSSEVVDLGEGLPDPAVLYGRAKAMARSRLNRGETAASRVLWTGKGPLVAHVALRSGGSSAEVRARRPDGAILGFVTLSASREVELTVDLRSFLEKDLYWGVVTREIVVRRGQASTFSRETGDRDGFQRVQEAATGTGWFSRNINHFHIPNSLYYYVSGGPASTCGELNTYRNNSWLFGPGWLCTDSSGSATKGPWYSAPADQKDDPSFIRWPNNSTTTNDWHIWDMTCPSISNYSSPFNGWYGTATDGVFGTCFTSSSLAYAAYWDGSTGLYWTPTSGGFNRPSSQNNKINCTLGSVPSCNASWTCPAPTLGGLSYRLYNYQFCIKDGGCLSCITYGFYY